MEAVRDVVDEREESCRRIERSSLARVVFHEQGSARQGCKPEGQGSRTNVQGIEAMAKADRSTAATRLPRGHSEGRGCQDDHDVLYKID